MSGADVIVTGAGGFIGGHLVQALIAEGRRVRAVDRKPLSAWHQVHGRADNMVRDLSTLESCQEILSGGAQEVYNLAADMGGMGFIESHKAYCMLSVLINTHMLMAARDNKAERFFFSSSACVYPADKQRDTEVVPLREEDAYPAMAEDGYGWEKLFSERMTRHFREDFGLSTRVGRYHNVYGPKGSWCGGREKVPAAACRKVAVAALAGGQEVEIWGDGRQMRSFMHVDDCVTGSIALTRSDYADPLNIGSSEAVSINDLYRLIQEIAGTRLRVRHVPGPLGVRGRNSDNALIHKELGWEPSIRLAEGLESTYRWIYDQVKAQLG
ncbi:NAD-dependent epimerase/dehydratase family protein [Micromonospora inyonensis]|uniref:Nucleoside-diphosphate-sugar epimerase n=1 Tax=Micromonospora inyonensis TaxID=47866 RepID=A0A1C6RL91_9ACTN|nr:NAD-dependent epimerase/dehydratase family protein [Micromonospora inyonensis]SCL17942.1 Nucleoside-diphosphate-sugar epimerase [Micromonospora inyonensis]